MPSLLKDQLKELSKQKNYKAIVDLMKTVVVGTQEQKQQLSDFIGEELNGEKQAAEEFAEQIIAAAADVYFSGIFQLGEKEEEWIEKINNGEVPEMKPVLDEPGLVKKVAKNIVLNQNKDLFVGYRVMTILVDEFGKKGIKIKEKDGGDYFKDKVVEIREKKAKEFGILPDTLADYEWYFKDEQEYKIGFKVKEGKPAEGESLFSDIPGNLKKINGCKTPEQLDALEEECYELEDANNIREIKAASAAKLYKKLYADFEELDKGEENPSQNYKDTKERLKNAARLGKDYIIMDVNVDRKLVKPTAGLGYSVIEDATEMLQYRSDDLYEELDERARNNRENGITGEKADHDIDLKNKVADVYNLTKQVRNINREFKDLSDSKKPDHDLDQDRKIRKYINKERENRKYHLANGVGNNSYCRTLTEQEERLSDSLMNDLVTFEGYDRLFKLIEKNKHLYIKKNYMDKEPPRDGEDLKKARERHNAAYEANCEELRAQILACKEFEKTFDDPANLAGHGMDRTKLLDRISRVLSREPNRDVDYEAARDIWSVQNNDLDNLWIGYQYMNMVLLKQNGEAFPEEVREKYGFNIYGDVSLDEENDARHFAKNVFNNCVEGKTLPELKRVIQSAGRFKIKCFVQAGKDYEDIRKALEGEENADLKAKYLYKKYASPYGYPGLDNMREALQVVVGDLIEQGILGDEIDLNDKNLTLGKFLDIIGAPEEKREEYYRKKKLSADKKFSELIENDKDYFWELKNYLTSVIISMCSAQGEQYELARLSGTDKKYFDYHQTINATEDNPDDYKPIEDWIKSEGDKLGKNLDDLLIVDKMQKATATLKNLKLAGVDPKTEIGRFYRNSMEKRNTYVAEVLKDKKDASEVIEKLVNEKKYDKLAKFNIKKMPVTYDVYVAKHTAGRGGETADEMVDNLSKVLAASALEQLGKSFSVSDIRRAAGQLKKTLVLDVLKSDEGRLREALRDRHSANKIGNEIRHSVYGVKPEDAGQYFSDMETLVQHMSGTKGRSSKYIALHNAIEAAAELKHKNMTPERMQSAIINANIRIHEAVQNYVSGKEKVRRSNKGKDSFDNALDAMAIIEKHVPGFRLHSVNLLNSINKVRNNNDAEAENYISHENFTTKFGAEHSREIAQKQKEIATRRKEENLRGPV